MSCMRNNHRTIFTVKKPPPLQKGRNERTCDNCMILSSLTCAPEAHSSSESLLLLISFSLVVSNRSRPKNASCVGGKIKCITNTENYNTIEHLEIKHIDVSQQIGQRQMFTKLWHWLQAAALFWWSVRRSQCIAFLEVSMKRRVWPFVWQEGKWECRRRTPFTINLIKR